MTDAQETTPALGWMAAREAAAGVAADYTPEKHGGAPLVAHVTGRNIQIAIRALPAPTSAQLLTEAMNLPEVAALVDRLAEFAARLADPDTRPNCTCRGCRPRRHQGRQPC